MNSSEACPARGMGSPAHVAREGAQELGVAGRLLAFGFPALRVSQTLAGSEGVKMLLCKLDVINPFHQLQIYLLNPIKNMNMQMQTFLNSHFQGLGVGV